MAFILGPDDSAFNYLREVPERFGVLNGVVVVAWARRAGVGLLYTALGDRLRNVDVIVGMANGGTSAEALMMLKVACRRVFVYHKHRLQTFHPKVYMFDDGLNPPDRATLLVGSSNLTGGGLYQNIEGNLALELQPSIQGGDAATYDSVTRAVTDLINSPFCRELVDNESITRLLNDRYISTEAALGRRKGRDNRAAAQRGIHWQQPEAPPPRLPQIVFPELEEIPVVDVQIVHLDPDDVIQQDIHDPQGEFYVRTLTENDVNKLHRRTPGTAEWDIGATARNQNPAFWGWPDEYHEVVRRLPRFEWESPGILRSNLTGEEGLNIGVALWFREQRPSHAAEHRLRINPIRTLRNAIPLNFDVNSLVVVERLPAGRNHTFLIQLLTPLDAGYEDYRLYLRHNRPRHRYGYGP